MSGKLLKKIAKKTWKLTHSEFLWKNRFCGAVFFQKNIAIATGEMSGVLVIDVDVSEGKAGEASLQALEAEIGPLPREDVAHTGSGGQHIYLKMPGLPLASSASRLAKHIDVRANGGYVIAPPSIHKSGNFYEWQNNNA